MKRAIELLLWAILIYTPLVLGGARLWAITPVFVTALLIFCLYLFDVNRCQAPAFRMTPVTVPLLLFLLLAGASLRWSVYPHATMLALYRLLAYGAIFCVIAHYLDGKEELGRIAAVVIGTGALLSFIGLILYLGHRFYHLWLPGDTLSATFMNRDHFAGYLEMVIPLACGYLCTGLSRTKRVLVGFLIVMMIVAFVLAASRGAWVSLMASSLILLPFVSRKKYLKIAALLAVIFGVILFYTLSHFDLSIAAARARTIIEGAGVDETRMATWLGTLDLIGAHPMLGSGLGTFVRAFQAFRPVGIYQYYLMDYAHNDYLQMAAELGLIGLALFLWIIIAAVATGLAEFSRTAHPFKRGIALGATVGVLSMALHSMVDFCLHIPANAIVFTVLIAIIMAIRRRRYD